MKALHRFLPAALAIGALLVTAAPAEAQAGPTVVVTANGPRAWVAGHWTVKLGRRVWIEGAFKPLVAPPPKRVWVAGHWTGRGRARHWVPGHYR